MVPPRAVFLLHTVWWGFYLAGLLARRADDGTEAGDAPASAERARAPLSRLAVGLHSIVIVGMYPILWWSTGTQASPGSARAAVAAGILLASAALIGWTTRSFRSYRLRAELDPGHRLATAGPFAHVRHPIYQSVDLLRVSVS